MSGSNRQGGESRIQSIFGCCRFLTLRASLNDFKFTLSVASLSDFSDIFNHYRQHCGSDLEAVVPSLSIKGSKLEFSGGDGFIIRPPLQASADLGCGGTEQRMALFMFLGQP